MSLLELNTTTKKQIDKATSKLEFDDIKKNSGNNKVYEIKVIWDSAIYARKLEDYLPSFYYLVL